MSLPLAVHSTARRAVPRYFTEPHSSRVLTGGLRRSRLGLAKSGANPHLRPIGCRNLSSWWPWTSSGPNTPSQGDSTLTPAPPTPPPLEGVSSATPFPPAPSGAPLSGNPLSNPDNLNAPLEVLSESPISDAATSIAYQIPPLQYGDLAALDLVHWTPVGFFVKVLEVVQVSTGLPWWATITLTTLGTRVLLVPLALKAVQNNARMAPIAKPLAEIREELTEAKAKRDTLALQRAAVKQQKLMKSAGVSPWSSVGAMLAQVTAQFGFFIALRRMCELPVVQLTQGGFGYLMDLTASDPYYILPLVNTLVINMQLRLTAKDVASVANPNMPHIINGFKMFSFLGVAFLSWLPAGLNVHLLVSIFAVCLQTLFTRIPSVRMKLGLPALSKLNIKPPTIRETIAFARNAWREKLREQEKMHFAEMEKRRRMQGIGGQRKVGGRRS
ncbi:hypothetical protein BD410DRAFT_835932 [Rickenella mellea]|uniref:Membrane insertase YidC/Oxa/ALB C-terminal domain-containing protein n=1 Tax=Rickenella mellea TaxID=50990 RepID=A0A4Y7QH96_9AGAM|nr:hypothetical protein BD410DRAFT_835932 [Rickenella mellea]